MGTPGARTNVRSVADDLSLPLLLPPPTCGLSREECRWNSNSTQNPWAARTGATWVHLTSVDNVQWSVLATEPAALPTSLTTGPGSVILLPGASGLAAAIVQGGARVGGLGPALGANATLATTAAASLTGFSVPVSAFALPAGAPGYTQINGASAWWEPAAQSFIAVVGSSTASGQAALLQYASASGTSAWRFVRCLWTFAPTPGLPANLSAIAAVDMFPVGPDGPAGMYGVLFSTPTTGVSYWLLATANFSATVPSFSVVGAGVVDNGTALAYARTHADSAGRRVLYGLLQEERAAAAVEAAGWSGVLSLPRAVSVDGSGRALQFAVAGEVDLLRTGAGLPFTNVALPANSSYTLGGVAAFGASLELNVTLTVNADFIANPDAALILRVRSSKLFGVDARATAVAPADEFTDVVMQLTSAPSCAAGAMYNHTDSLANDYASPTLDSADPTLCRAMCCNDPQCTMYTFVYVQPLETPRSAAATTAAWDPAVLPAALRARIRDGTCYSGALNCCWLKSGPGSLLTPGGCPECVSGFNPLTSSFSVTIDRSASSLNPNVTTTPSVGVIQGSASASVNLRVFVDASTVEVFDSASQVALSTRVYPTLPTATNVELVAIGGSATFSATAWELDAATSRQRRQ